MKPLILVLGLMHGADAVSTCQILAKGGVEQNIVLPSSCTPLVLTKTAEAALTGFGLVKLHEKHPALARWLAIGAIAVEAGAVAHNAHDLRR